MYEKKNLFCFFLIESFFLFLQKIRPYSDFISSLNINFSFFLILQKLSI